MLYICILPVQGPNLLSDYLIFQSESDLIQMTLNFYVCEVPYHHGNSTDFLHLY